jgi:hypothetical protein
MRAKEEREQRFREMWTRGEGERTLTATAAPLNFVPVRVNVRQTEFVWETRLTDESRFFGSRGGCFRQLLKRSSFESSLSLLRRLSERKPRPLDRGSLPSVLERPKHVDSGAMTDNPIVKTLVVQGEGTNGVGNPLRTVGTKVEVVATLGVDLQM